MAGASSARELFDTLLLWRARVPLDAAGDAIVEIPLNDSLTSFRIVAIASSGAELFGTGDASIRSTQDLMLLSGLPPVVRESDRFRASFTLRNASERQHAGAVDRTHRGERKSHWQRSSRARSSSHRARRARLRGT